jgi:hypothetical protein
VIGKKSLKPLSHQITLLLPYQQSCTNQADIRRLASAIEEMSFIVEDRVGGHDMF